jgi:hypothetical protein
MFVTKKRKRNTAMNIFGLTYLSLFIDISFWLELYKFDIFVYIFNLTFELT